MAEASSESGLTSAQALYVVEQLIKTRRVSAREISRVAQGMAQEIAKLERRLAVLRADSSPNTSAKRSGPVKPRQANVSPQVAASRRLQGEYMGLMRHMVGRDRVRMKNLAAEKGREAAVKEMRSIAGR